MSEILKGNFKTQREVEQKKEEESLEKRFEREALKRLGGSIAFVSKQKVMWGDDGEPSKDVPDGKKPKR
jgi:hypothetical protein